MKMKNYLNLLLRTMPMPSRDLKFWGEEKEEIFYFNSLSNLAKVSLPFNEPLE